MIFGDLDGKLTYSNCHQLHFLSHVGNLKLAARVVSLFSALEQWSQPNQLFIDYWQLGAGSLCSRTKTTGTPKLQKMWTQQHFDIKEANGREDENVIHVFLAPYFPCHTFSIFLSVTIEDIQDLRQNSALLLSDGLVVDNLCAKTSLRRLQNGGGSTVQMHKFS